MYDRCLAILEFVLDDTHPQLQSCVAARGACLVATGRGVEAVEELSRALQLAERRWERTHEEWLARHGEKTEVTRSKPARYGFAEEDPAEAPALDPAVNAVDGADRMVSEGDASPPEPQEDPVAEVEASPRAPVDAGGHERMDGPPAALRSEADHVAAVVLQSQENLARLLHSQGHFAKGLALQESALDLIARVHGVGDALIAAYNTLAVAYQRREMRKEALALVRKRMALIGRGHDTRISGAEPPVGHLSLWYNIE